MILLANFLTDFFVGVDAVKLVDFFTRLILCCTTDNLNSDFDEK